MEKLPLNGKPQGASSSNAVQVVANVQIQKQDSVCSNPDEYNSAECYVGHVTHLRSKMVKCFIMFLKREGVYSYVHYTIEANRGLSFNFSKNEIL